MIPHRPFDPSLLDAIEKSVVEYHLIARQPVPIRTPRVTYKLSVTLARVADLRNLVGLESVDIIEPVSYEEYTAVDHP